ncbi:hypothetical protein E0Z10_g2975 [Xylaria hypoxylon]|uniref:SPX domain-containing protein n=1 Tax=Xylaria hypoxylon TaxID=37992 RepID=A0A4Z0ZAX6_9PEZI|nr:hypothetical protein E0Z10_g2975 [Xylaria hypoxylon]
MKFAKELEQDLVPEWRIKYLNYKAGKKYVKGVARAIHRVNSTPRAPSRRHDNPPPHDAPSFFRSPFLHQPGSRGINSQGPEDAHLLTSGPAPLGQAARSEPANVPAPSERQSLNSPGANEANYGSFVRTPPASSGLSKLDSRQTFELPGPAIHLPPAAENKAGTSRDFASEMTSGIRLGRRRSTSIEPVIARKSQAATFPRPSPLPHPSPASTRLRRLFSQGPQLQRVESSKAVYPLQAIDTVRQREKEFFDFLDGELAKVETFYRQKEIHAENRLNALREQLHEMRNRRTQEIAELRQRKHHKIDGADDFVGQSSGFNGHHNWIDPIKSRIFKPGANSKALAGMPQTPVVGTMSGDARRDYIRRPQEHDVSYKTAKRKLKLALQEFYRGLELLKSYALLNRTAFRKLNKKYDKAVNARPPYRYMNEKVNKSWFVNSEALDGHIKAVEDLYARYFEKGNHKIAAGKLRQMNRRPTDESSIAFWNGLSIGIGAVFTIQGLVYGSQLLFDPDPTIRLQASYLLQIYGGYFLILLLFSLFCIDCYLWTANKINYPFIFEFDPRHHLDWRQLASFPGFFLLLFGVFFWLNFTRYGNDELWLYYPVILIVISLLIIFLPAPILWHKSRQWLAYSHFRLFFAGLYPVEFRDFFLGDIYCSLTYATSNVELFFCLYANYWENPPISVWDLFMDFSLLQPDARHPLLRDILGLKRRWLYYAIMVIDPILRFGWIFYAIFTHNTQHNTIVSFLVSLSEVIRRGMWALLRVENEHCGNVAQYKASRDVPLPYDLPHEPLIDRTSTEDILERSNQESSNIDLSRTPSQYQGRSDGQPSAYSPAPVEEAGLRRRRKSEGIVAKSIRGIMANAHRQDFEKKRRPPIEVDQDMGALSPDELRSEDEEDDDSRSMAEDRLEIRRVETLVRGEESEDDDE